VTRHRLRAKPVFSTGAIAIDDARAPLLLESIFHSTELL
jgi:hypothetical protein